MGEGLIQSGGKGGYYNIEIVKNLTTVTKRKAALATRIASFVILIATATTELDTAQAALTTAKTTLQTTILLAIPEDVVKAQAAVVLAQGTVNTKQGILDSLKLEQESLNKEKALLDVKASKELAGVWCADLSERLSRTVGTLEINGEAGKTKRILIMPGGVTGAGKIEPSENSTPSGVFYNWAVLPAWQKIKPTYRTGVLTAINFAANTCTVSLDPALSSVQSFNINQAAVLSGIPIVYMTCHAGAFVVGDAVVVKFEGQLQAAPKVIGFASNPKGCGYVFEFVDPLGLTGSAPDAECSFVSPAPDYVWHSVACTSTYSAGKLTVVPSYEYFDWQTNAMVTLPHTTPLHFAIVNQGVRVNGFATEEAYWAGGGIPVGRYRMTIWGSTSTSTQENQYPGDRSKGTLPVEGSITKTISTFGPYTKYFSGSMVLAGFDVYGDDPVPGQYSYTEPMWAFRYGVFPGRIIFHRAYVLGGSGPLGINAGLHDLDYGIVVTVHASPLAISNFEWFSQTDTGHGEHDQDVADILAGKPVWLDNSGFLGLGWSDAGSSINWEAVKVPGDWDITRNVRISFDFGGYAFLQSAYLANTVAI